MALFNHSLQVNIWNCVSPIYKWPTPANFASRGFSNTSVFVNLCITFLYGKCMFDYYLIHSCFWHSLVELTEHSKRCEIPFGQNTPRWIGLIYPSTHKVLRVVILDSIDLFVIISGHNPNRGNCLNILNFPVFII